MRVCSNNVRNGLAAARRILGLTLNESREIVRSGQEGLYRCTLANGKIIEVTVRNRWPRGHSMEAGFSCVR